jgi:hypothetical protein
MSGRGASAQPVLRVDDELAEHGRIDAVAAHQCFGQWIGEEIFEPRLDAALGLQFTARRTCPSTGYRGCRHCLEMSSVGPFVCDEFQHMNLPSWSGRTP